MVNFEVKVFVIISLFLLLNLTLVSCSDCPIIKLDNTEKEQSKVSFFDFFINLFSFGKKTTSIQLIAPVVKTKSQVSNDPIIDSNEDINVGSESTKISNTKTSVGLSPYLGSIINLRDDSREASDDNLNDQIINKEGIGYIVRDGKEFLLAPEDPNVDYYIEIVPILPSSVCRDEEIDFIVRGVAKYSPNIEEQMKCGLGQYVGAAWTVSLMESDLGSDDEVSWRAGVAQAYPPSCDHFYFEAHFTDVVLSGEIIDDPGAEGEFYAKVYGLDNKVSEMSTPTYNIYGYVNGECDCISGACCDLRSRPYDFKASLSQPTGYTDYYFCSGENSPIGTNYVERADFYCNGVSSSSQYRDFVVDTCGICLGCSSGDPVCSPYHTTEVCGTKDCDYLDTICRNYNDVSNYCNGNGACGSSSCNSYTNAVSGTPCGQNSVCDGSGNCVSDCECSVGACCDGCHYRSNSYVCNNEYEVGYGCPYGEGIGVPGADVYKRVKQRYCSGSSTTCSGVISSWSSWSLYDSCSSDEYCISNNQNCNSCISHLSYFCHDGDVYWYDECGNREDKKQECGTNDCVYDSCLTEIRCSRNSDCGVDGFIGNSSCSSGDVYQTFRSYICNNPGTTSSYCSTIDESRKIEECEELYCLNGVCLGEIYKKDLIKGWNEINVSLVPLNKSIGNFLFSVNGLYSNVWSNVNGEWLSYSPSVLPGMNTLLNVSVGMSLQVEMKENAGFFFLFYPIGNAQKTYDDCFVACEMERRYDYCTMVRNLEIEGQIINGNCHYFYLNYPLIGIENCNKLTCIY